MFSADGIRADRQPSPVETPQVWGALRNVYAAASGEYPVDQSAAWGRFQDAASAFVATDAAWERLLIAPVMRYGQRFAAFLADHPRYLARSPMHLRPKVDLLDPDQGKPSAAFYAAHGARIEGWIRTRLDNIQILWRAKREHPFATHEAFAEVAAEARSLALHLPPRRAINIVHLLTEVYEAYDATPRRFDVLFQALQNRRWLIELAERTGAVSFAITHAERMVEEGAGFFSLPEVMAQQELQGVVLEQMLFATLARARLSSERRVDDDGVVTYGPGNDAAWKNAAAAAETLLAFQRAHHYVSTATIAPLIAEVLRLVAMQHEMGQRFLEAAETFDRAASLIFLAMAPRLREPGTHHLDVAEIFLQTAMAFSRLKGDHRPVRVADMWGRLEAAPSGPSFADIAYARFFRARSIAAAFDVDAYRQAMVGDGYRSDLKWLQLATRRLRIMTQVQASAGMSLSEERSLLSRLIGDGVSRVGICVRGYQMHDPSDNPDGAMEAYHELVGLAREIRQGGEVVVQMKGDDHVATIARRDLVELQASMVSMRHIILAVTPGALGPMAVIPPVLSLNPMAIPL